MDNERLVKMVEDGEITVLEAIEDSQRYAKALEDIIERIELPNTTRKLVDVLVKEARKETRR